MTSIPATGSIARMSTAIGSSFAGVRAVVGARHGVHAPVHAVDEIHIRDAGRTIERLGARGSSRGGVARKIVLSDVRLGFDDASGDNSIVGATLDDCAKELARDDF